ncbi:MFS transporter [Paenibacillus macerans]|uniref:MFS transporter n=1 Tax=Paenibacillus macerans TaxID=44252 RepID=UPI003D3231CA
MPSSSISLFRNRFVRAVLVSNLFSQLGIWIRNLSVLLYVMHRTEGDALAVSMVSVAEYAPIFAFSFIGGAFADRWRPKATILCCESLSSLSVFLIFLWLENGIWQAVFFATLCSSVLSQFAQPPGMKLFKMHLRGDEATACMSLLQTLFSIFMIAGPVIGTWIYRQLGIRPAILLTCVCFLLSAVSLLVMPADRREATDPEGTRGSLWVDLKDGLRYVAGHRNLLSLSLCFMIVGLGVGLISPLSIFVVTERLGLPAEALSWIQIPYGLGELAGGLVTFLVAAKIAPQRLLTIGLLANAAGIALTGLSSSLWLTMLAQLGIALLQPAIFIGNNALVMQQTETAYIGRVTGIRTPLMTGAMLLAMSLVGVLKSVLTLEGIYVLAGGCFAAGLLILLPYRGTNRNAAGEA